MSVGRRRFLTAAGFMFRSVKLSLQILDLSITAGSWGPGREGRSPEIKEERTPPPGTSALTESGIQKAAERLLLAQVDPSRRAGVSGLEPTGATQETDLSSVWM